MTTAINTPVIPGYQIKEQLYIGSKTIVYRGIREEDSKAVVMKFLALEYPSFNDLLQFRNQYIISKNLNIPGIIRPLSLEVYGNGYVLVMEDTGGVSLREYIKTTTLSRVEFLALAIQLSDILHNLHRNRVIHKDIKPANILIHPETKQVELIDFSIASLLPRETQEIKSPNVLEGTLAYISPEQTGRMNRGIDYRSDFYSLGVTFYELLTGQLPFISDDAMELVHCHIAQLPRSVSDVTEIPRVISEIINKLMAKNAEDRYQSALGLKHDLENCLYQLKDTGEITDFEIGKRDLCELFIIPEKLYGREAEVQMLLDAFERVAYCHEAKSEMMLVAGFSGIGKTAVVSSVHKPITRANGYFIKGKFDQFNRNIPLSAFVEALRDLMGQLLSEADARLIEWRNLILEAVGENGQVLIDVIPELERVIGKQPGAVELSGIAAQNRFNLLFQKFIEVFTTKEHPLIMFLDDLQWADSASLQLIKLLMGDKGYLLLLGAYRDNEVSIAHPFMLMREELLKGGVTVNTITLAPLAFHDTNQLVADTLHCSTLSARPLTELIERKTQGNPFFITQFLKALYEDEHIKFNREQSYWECDIAQINALSLTSDVVDFMAQQLQKLPAETQEILKLAACIGNQFDLNTLAIVSEQSEASQAAVLWKALQEGIILPQSNVYKFYLSFQEENANTNNIENVGYRFLHDRVQQAAYSLIPDDQKQTTHYQIGQLLLQRISPEAIEDSIFEVINQLNYGTSLITEQTQRDELAQLNLIACRKAKAATAYQAAREYASTGLSLLGENPWQRQYKMCLAFHNELAEVATLSGDFKAMEQFIETVTEKAQSLLEKVYVYRIKILANVSQNKLTEAIEEAQQILQQLGVTFPECTQENIQRSIAEIEKLIGDREIGALINLPQMTDEEKIAIVQIANSIMPAASISGSPFYPLLVCLSVKLSIKYGNSLGSGYAYVNYGIIACNIKQDVDAGVKFGELGLRVVFELNAKAVKPEVLVVSGLFIWHRKSHIKETLPLLQEAYVTALEVGNHEACGYSAHIYCLNSFWCGQPLTSLEQETGAFCNKLVQLNQLNTANWCQIYWQSILNLLGVVEHPSILSGEAFSEEEFLPLLMSSRDFSGLHLFYLYKLMLCYLFGEIESAQNHAVSVRRYLMAGIGSVTEPAFYFYDSLVAAEASTQSEETLEALIRRIEQNQTQLSHWAYYAPMNHQHKVDLVEAEKCRILGQKTEAIELYDKATRGANLNGYIQEVALANELCAKFYLNWGKEKAAAGYMQEAYYCYARWGAKAKTSDLEKRYPQLLKPILQQRRLNLNPLETIATVARSSISTSISTSACTTHSSSSISNVLDFTSILKAAIAISSSIKVDELITNLTKIILENSGALKTILILPQENTWQVRAITFINYENRQQGEIQNLLTSESIDTCEYVPKKLINYVKNTQETVVIDNCKTDTPGVIGEYMLLNQPKSVLCTPIVNQGHVVGILYLENKITSSVFTKNSLLIINLLSSQAAISLENARLYQRATEALQDLQQAQLQIVQSEKMSALGNLVAGVAHEMNNPLGFIAATLKQAQPAIADITEHLKLYQEIPNIEQEIIDHAESIDLDYTLSDLPKMIDAMVMACDRLKNISTSLRTFSRADKDYKVPFNIHEGIDSTILILKHRLKANEQRPAIEVITEYGNLPKIECFPGQLNQVFMNILANAIDALEESNSARSFEEIQANPNRITIKTSVENTNVKISIADNGKGMSEEVKQKIFDYLFTTKAVGKGTGLGLAIARQIIEETHAGKLCCNSVVGEGTEFVIMLPQ